MLCSLQAKVWADLDPIRARVYDSSIYLALTQQLQLFSAMPATLAAIGDILITVVLCYYLYQARTLAYWQKCVNSRRKCRSTLIA